MIDYPFCDVLLFTSWIWSGNQPAPFFSPLSLGLLLTQFAEAVWSLAACHLWMRKGTGRGWRWWWCGGQNDVEEGKKVLFWRGERGRDFSDSRVLLAQILLIWAVMSSEPKAAVLIQKWSPPPRRPCSPPCPLLFLINCHYQDWNAGICSLLSRPPHLSCHFISVNKAGEKATSENRMNIWNRGRNLSIETKRPRKKERKEQDLPQ